MPADFTISIVLPAVPGRSLRSADRPLVVVPRINLAGTLRPTRFFMRRTLALEFASITSQNAM